MHQQVIQFPNTHTIYIYIYMQFSLSLYKKNKKQNKSGINLKTHIIRFCSFNTICNMQYAESLHEIVIRGIHYDSKTSSDHKMCTLCTCHTDYRLLYNSDHFNTNFSYFFSDTYIVFKASILFLRCVQTQRKRLCFHSFLFNKYKTQQRVHNNSIYL